MKNLDQTQIEINEKNSKIIALRGVLFEILQILVFFFIFDSVVARDRVHNISMEPTLVPGEILMVSKLQYKFREVGHGDIITFRFPLDPDRNFIKRVIGLPGDEVDIHAGEVFVNGRQLFEPYISAKPLYEGSWTIPQGSLFVLGDNRNPSADSHVWGFVPLENVIGKAFLVYWPVTHIRGLSTPDVFLPSP